MEIITQLFTTAEVMLAIPMIFIYLILFVMLVWKIIFIGSLALASVIIIVCSFVEHRINTKGNCK